MISSNIESTNLHTFHKQLEERLYIKKNQQKKSSKTSAVRLTTPLVLILVKKPNPIGVYSKTRWKTNYFLIQRHSSSYCEKHVSLSAQCCCLSLTFVILQITARKFEQKLDLIINGPGGFENSGNLEG